MSSYLSRRSELDYRDSARREAGGDESPPPADDGKSPGLTALVTFLAFVVAGWTPSFPYISDLTPVFPFSLAFTGVTFFLVGASRSVVTARVVRQRDRDVRRRHARRGRRLHRRRPPRRYRVIREFDGRSRRGEEDVSDTLRRIRQSRERRV